MLAVSCAACKLLQTTQRMSDTNSYLAVKGRSPLPATGAPNAVTDAAFVPTAHRDAVGSTFTIVPPSSGRGTSATAFAPVVERQNSETK